MHDRKLFGDLDVEQAASQATTCFDKSCCVHFLDTTSFKNFGLQNSICKQDRKLFGDLAAELAASQTTTCLTKPATYYIFFTTLHNLLHSIHFTKPQNGLFTEFALQTGPEAVRRPGCGAGGKQGLEARHGTPRVL